MSDPVPERLEAAMLGGHWQSSLQALSMDSVLPCWPFLNLVVPEISAIVVCKLAKVAYMAFQNGERNPYFADYSPNHIYEVVTRFRTQISVECGQNVEITITNWVLEEFPRSASDCLIEMQLHSGIMAYWHNWLNAQDSVKLSSTVKGVIRQTIGKWFFPAPYELAAAAMNDMTQLGQWDRELIESFPDSANVTDGINNHLLNVNIRRFMDNLKETIGEHASGEFKTWCLKFNWHSGPYKGPNYQL